MAATPATDALTKSKHLLGSHPLRHDVLVQLLRDRFETDRRLRRDRLARDERAYRWIIRKAFAERDRAFRTTHQQAAKGLGYETSGDRDADFVRFQSRVQNPLNSLQDAGLIRWGGIKRPNGQWWCLRIELCDGDELERSIAAARTRICVSSTCGTHDNRGGATPRRRSRRPGTPRPAVIDPPGRRGSHNAEPTPESPGKAPPPEGSIFFDPHEVGSPTARGEDAPLRGAYFPPLLSRGPTRGREAAGESAPEPPPPGLGRGEGELADPVAELVAHFAATLGAERARRGKPIGGFSWQRWAWPLRRALRRLDRYADRGAGRAGAGAQLARDLIAEQAEAERDFGESTAISLAYFVPVLDETSKAWRRHHKRSTRERSRLWPGWRKSLPSWAWGGAEKAGGRPQPPTGNRPAPGEREGGP